MGKRSENTAKKYSRHYTSLAKRSNVTWHEWQRVHTRMAYGAGLKLHELETWRHGPPFLR